MRKYRRHLPHQVPDGAAIFLTWNLKGAIPGQVIERLRRQREQLQREPRRKDESPRDRALRHGKLIFGQADEFLDRTDRGPLYLKDPAAARIVEEAILFGVRDQRYELFAWCVMANHVHLLICPLWELAKITQGIKGFTAHEINRLRGTSGTFWQDESYDHWVRDEEELLRIIAYIENNPVKAGLSANPQDWLWSSARRRMFWTAGQVLRSDEFSQQLQAQPSAWKG